MPSARSLVGGVIAVLVAGSVTLLPTSADAATYTSTGLRCTKVGTPHADRIQGTKRRDVICGRGGNDTINGLGGNDVIDGGAGDDVLLGGAGNDRVLGGLGRDTLYGEDGDDTLAGQWDDDRILGGSGNDAISGDSGADRVDASSGNDVVLGGTGNDTLQAGTGNDRVDAGDGNDNVTGSDGNDVLSGAAGNDDLLGGAGSDHIYGGSGTNWCDATSTDSQTACKRDLQAPQILGLSLSRSTVDVSNGPATLTASVHLTDDTGVRQVQIGRVATLTRGDVRDGWWTTTLTVPRYSLAGPRELDLSVTDRVGRYNATFWADRLTVVNRNPDRSPPVLRSMAVSPQSVDVRTAAKTVTATVRITDDLSGVVRADLCPAHLFADLYRQSDACPGMQLISGTDRDGYWRASYTVPRGAVGGSWNFQVWIDDASGNHPEQYYIGPDQVQWETAHDASSGGLPIPGRAGRFTVTGTSDNHAPVLTSVTMSPPSVDVSTRSATVTIDLAATDVEGITGAGMSVEGVGDLGPIDLGMYQDPVLVSGTSRNGVWRFQVPIAQGTPTGPYTLQVWLDDKTHFVSWVSPEASSSYPDLPPLTAQQTPTGSVITVR